MKVTKEFYRKVIVEFLAWQTQRRKSLIQTDIGTEARLSIDKIEEIQKRLLNSTF